VIKNKLGFSGMIVLLLAALPTQIPANELVESFTDRSFLESSQKKRTFSVIISRESF
jgi:hypothetical protein